MPEHPTKKYKKLFFCKHGSRQCYYCEKIKFAFVLKYANIPKLPKDMKKYICEYFKKQSHGTSVLVVFRMNL